MRKGFVFFFALLLFFSKIQAREIVPPLDIPLFLSGNFGELRSNHFHSGIDFKTQGRIGIPVKSIKEGYIARICVSSGGYGNVVYVNHPDGTSSVYAHLENFIPTVEAAVRDSQYLKESFSVNLYFEPENFPLQQGEIFAYSGNTGSSGGPHLHFEIRDSNSERVLDPLPFFKDKIRDTRPPEIRGLMVFPQSGKGIVNGSVANQIIPLVKNKAGKQTVGKSIKAWGEIGVGVSSYDRMTETSNIYGVNEIILMVDGEEVYHSVLNAFFLDDTRYLNSYIDWKTWIETGAFYMKSFTEPGNRLWVNRIWNNGIVRIDEERTYRFEYQLIDLYGNTSSLLFDVSGEEAEIPSLPEKAFCFPFNQNNTYCDKGIDLEIPIKNLYTNTYLDIDTVLNHSIYAPLYVIGERIPLHSYCDLSLDIPQDTCVDKSKYGVVYEYKTRKNWLGGTYENGKMHVKIRELGNFSIQSDWKAPVITPLGKAKWTANKKLSFKITDNLSGIDSWKGTLDGEFVLFEYDAKNRYLYCKYDEKRMKKGRQQLRLVVTDKARNEAVIEKNIVF